jgi:hypothetical protein
MALSDTKTSFPDSEDQSLVTLRLYRERRWVVRRLWDVTTLALVIGLIYRWIQMQGVTPLGAVIGESIEGCSNSIAHTEPEFDWFSVSHISIHNAASAEF